ncbi:MAG: GMP synthase subunit A [Candidatus Bilamarchaeaceae archaeon]
MAVLIIDNGSQYTHLIKRNCRDMGFEGTIVNDKAERPDFSPEKVIISGGPSSVGTKARGISEECIAECMKEGTPLLGICFGHQMIAHLNGGLVEKGEKGEYGISEVTIDNEDTIFKGVPKRINAWVSHFDEVKRMPPEFEALAHSETCKIEAMRHLKKPVFSVQFHPEVWHTQHGERILENFLKV